MSTTGDGIWYVARTQLNAEAKAARNLLRQGFEIYLPLYLKRRSHARKVEKVPAPLFPRYLFVRFDMATQRWRSVYSTFGVSQLVSNGGDPAPVAHDVISLLKAREDESGFIKMDCRPRFSIGDKLRMLEGAFAGNLGLFDGLGNNDRVAILLNLLGRKVRVSIDAEMVTAA
jgi:transcriptional antiterminator RfaH